MKHFCGVCRKVITNNQWWDSFRYAKGKSLCPKDFMAFKDKEFFEYRKAHPIINYNK